MVRTASSSRVHDASCCTEGGGPEISLTQVRKKIKRVGIRAIDKAKVGAIKRLQGVITPPTGVAVLEARNCKVCFKKD